MRYRVFLTVVAMLAGLSAAGGPVSAEPAKSWSLSPDARRCLARTIYFEARGEEEAGQRAIANVVLNRVAHPDFPDTVCGVVRQGGETPPCQFSWWCDGKSDEPREVDAWETARRIVREVAADPQQDVTKGAVYFHNIGVKPRWSLEFDRVGRIGDHVYYRPPEE